MRCYGSSDTEQGGFWLNVRRAEESVAKGRPGFGLVPGAGAARGGRITQAVPYTEP